MSNIGRNSECLCGSGKKYKRCCLGQVDWEKLSKLPFTQQLRSLSLRGKNILFMGRIMDALQIDKWHANLPFSAIKKAFTPHVVRKIYEFIPILWPDFSDYETCHAKERDTVSALYTGSYEPEDIFKALTRHSMYSERIFLVDPFMDPRVVQDEYNPVLHPEEHRTSAIKFTYLWLSLYPWIDSGIVNFIRSPIDFSPGLWHDILELQQQRVQRFPELKKLIDRQAKDRLANLKALDGGMIEYYYLAHSDEHLVKMFAESSGFGFMSKEEFLSYIQLRRDNHPYYVAKLDNQHAEFFHETSGACYELSKLICSITDSHLITNIPSRWKEVELDREEAGIHIKNWSPFAKALQDSDLRVLNEISIDGALILRKENRLERMRLFFRKVWLSCHEPNEFDDINSLNLTAELSEKIAEAESEWVKIDQDLMKWFGITGGAVITSGIVGFVPAGVAATITGAASLIEAQLKRKNFCRQFPAGFFLDAKKR